MKNVVLRFLQCRSGATSIEYGLVAALIGVAIIAAVKPAGTNVGGTFNKVKNNLT